ncbi:MAG: thioesterase family protein [Burkholderiaceae bacterium]
MTDTPTPFSDYTDEVRVEWVDFNDHFHMGYYALAFEHAQQAFLAHLGLFADGWPDGARMATREIHVCFLRELRERAPLRFETLLLDHDASRVHCIHRMLHAAEGYVAATGEIVSECVDVADERHAIGFVPHVDQSLGRMRAEHARLDMPEQRGRAIRLVRRG